MCGDLALRGRDDHIGSGPLERIELNALRGVSAGRELGARRPRRDQRVDVAASTLDLSHSYFFMRWGCKNTLDAISPPGVGSGEPRKIKTNEKRNALVARYAERRTGLLAGPLVFDGFLERLRTSL